jgi:hypothetical protein
MPETLQPVVLLIGECQSPQFCAALSDGQTADILEAVDSHNVQSLPDAISVVRTGEFIPDLVISYQSIPDEYSAADIDRLIGMLPLSRFVVAFSPWCESIGRTEQRWPSAWSVPLAHAATRIRLELQQLADDSRPLLATTSRDEAFATLAAHSLEQTDHPGRRMSAHIISADVSLKECFESIACSLGFEIFDTDPSSQAPTVHILVAPFIDSKNFRLIQQLRDNNPAARIIVASDMATPAEKILLQDAGAAAVISQLRFAEDLVDQLRGGLLSEPEATAEK